MLPTGWARLYNALTRHRLWPAGEVGREGAHLLAAPCLSTEIDDPRSAIADQLYRLIRAAHGNVHYAGN
jgi:hypothetical protein